MLLSELRTRFRDKILAIAEECHIETVKVFGSTVRGEARDDSDIDLLISIKGATLLDVGRFQWKVQDLVKKRVDVVFEKGLHYAIADRVRREALPL